ncbi:hypothetical protein Esti_003866 [Eimeria stiedai]
MATLRSLWIIASSTCGNCEGGPYEAAPFGAPDDLLHRAPLPLPACRGAPSRMLQRSSKGEAGEAGRLSHQGASPSPQQQQPAATTASPVAAAPLTTQTKIADASEGRNDKPPTATTAAAAAEHLQQSAFQVKKSPLSGRAETRPAAAAAAAAAARGGGWTPAAAAAGGAPVGPHPVVYGEGCTARLLFSRVFPSAEARWQRLARRLYTPLPTDGELLGCFFSQVLLPSQDDATPAAAAAAAGPSSAAAAAAADWRTEQQQEQQQQPLFFFDALQETYYKELTWPCGPLLLLAVPRRGLAAAADLQQQQQQHRCVSASAGAATTAAAAAAAAGTGRSGDTASVQWQHGVGPPGISDRAATVAAAAATAAAAAGFLWPVAFVRRRIGGSYAESRCSCGSSCSSPLAAAAAAAAASPAVRVYSCVECLIATLRMLVTPGNPFLQLRSPSSVLLLLQTTAAFGFLDDLLELFTATLSPVPIPDTAAAAAGVGDVNSLKKGGTGSSSSSSSAAAAAAAAASEAARQGRRLPPAAGAAAGAPGALAAPFGRPQVTELRQLLLLLKQLQSAPPRTLPDLAASKSSAASTAAAAAAAAAASQGQQEQEQQQQQQDQQEQQQDQQQEQQRHRTEVELLLPPKPTFEGPPQSVAALRRRALAARGLLADLLEGTEAEESPDLRSLLSRCPYTPAAAATAAGAGAAAAATATESAPPDMREGCIRSYQVTQWRKQLQQQQQEGQWRRDTEPGVPTRSPLNLQNEGKVGLWGPSPPQGGGPPAASVERAVAAAPVSGFVPAAAAPQLIISNSNSRSSSNANVLRTEAEKRPFSPDGPLAQGSRSSSSNSSSKEGGGSGKVSIEVHIKETFSCQLKGHEDAETPQQETSVGGELWLCAPLGFPGEVSLPVSFLGPAHLPSLSVHQTARLHTNLEERFSGGGEGPSSPLPGGPPTARLLVTPLPSPFLLCTYFFNKVRQPPFSGVYQVKETSPGVLRLLLQLRVSQAAAKYLDRLQVALPFCHRGSLTSDDLKASQGTFRVVNAGEAVLWTIPTPLEGAPDSKIGDAPAHSLSLLGELRVGPATHQLSLQQQQQQQEQQQQRPWAAAGDLDAAEDTQLLQEAVAAAASGLPLVVQRFVLQQTRLRLMQQQQQQQQQGAAVRSPAHIPSTSPGSATRASSSSSCSSSSFLTEREKIVLDIGRSNFAAVVLLEGRGLSVAGAHVNPAAVDVFALTQEGAAAPAAAPAAAAAATASGGFTVKVNTSITAGRSENAAAAAVAAAAPAAATATRVAVSACIAGASFGMCWGTTGPPELR